MPLIASLVYKANSIFEVYFYIKMLSKFHTSFFSKTCLLENLAPRVLCLFELKVGLSLSKKFFFICLNDRSSKMMKNAFIFNLKALFVLKIFNFCLDFLRPVSNMLFFQLLLIFLQVRIFQLTRLGISITRRTAR